MQIREVVNHFGSKSALANALNISKQAVSLWGDDIPPLRQLQIEEVTGGAIKAQRPTVYAPKYNQR